MEHVIAAVAVSNLIVGLAVFWVADGIRCDVRGLRDEISHELSEREKRERSQ